MAGLSSTLFGLTSTQETEDVMMSYSTSERRAKAAAHPHGTAHGQNICVTIRILLTQKTERGGGGGGWRREGEGRTMGWTVRRVMRR